MGPDLRRVLALLGGYCQSEPAIYKDGARSTASARRAQTHRKEPILAQRTSSAFKAVATYVAIIVVTLAAGEILARTYDWVPRVRETAVGDDLGPLRYNHSQTGVGDLVPNQDGHWITWFHRPYHVQTNSAGLRSTAEPSERAFRILAVGDSQTYGPYLTNEDTWPGWLDNELRRGKPDKVQVFNAGIAGYTILDELALLREKGVAFKPNLVILAVFENDLDDLKRDNNGMVQRPTRKRADGFATDLENFLGRNSALIGLADHIKSSLQFRQAGVDVRRGESRAVPPVSSAPAAPQAPAPPHPLAARYGELFGQTVTLLKSNSIAFAVIFIPPPGALNGSELSGMEPVIRALTARSGTPYLDLTETMRAEAEGPTRLYLLQRDPANNALVGNGHLSRQGNAIIAARLAKWLAEQGLLGR
jgi:lysophospholipase L1-like esterase